MAYKDQGRGHKTVEGRICQTCAQSQLDSQCCACTQEGWKGKGVCGLRDLNKAYPKDGFPLLHIDVLVDNTAGSASMSFMDGLLRYNQIKMALKDMTNTTFTTEWGIYCCTVMPFGLKNAVQLTKNGYSFVT